jgi:hypothetical protein
MKRMTSPMAKRMRAIRLIERGERLKKRLCACIAIGMALLTLAIAID